MFRNLIFDWSGTLVDDLGPVLDATNAVLEAYGRRRLSRQEFRRHFRLPYEEFYAEFLPGVPIAELEEVFRRAFAASGSPVAVLPHARDKLEWCRDRGIRCFVLTSMDRDAFLAQLGEFGLGHLFEATYAGALDKRHVIRELLERHRLRPRETAFVGDMSHDVVTARHGGITSIAVLTGYTGAAALAECRPDLTVPDLRVLRELLERGLPGAAAGRPVATVGALIHDGAGRVLVVRGGKWRGRWGLPGGKIERGESALDALRREILEETGLQLAEPRFVMVQDSIDSDEFHRPEHMLLLNYLARSAGGEVRLDAEADEFRWLTPAEAGRLPLNLPTRVLLDRCVGEGMIPCGDT
jgi:phosphoglycolate phosphatase-like HAD superfamily hydrolase/ADP-ribose pyrophosphatase YjhB (NUDIX family)